MEGARFAQQATAQLSKDGYQLIAPGQSRRWGPMSLSLWQQGTCVKSVLVNEKTVRVETLYMRPIFSGMTANSNNDHRIQWWIKKWGTEKQNIEAYAGGKRVLAANDEATEVEAEPEALPATDKLVYFYENGSNTYAN